MLNFLDRNSRMSFSITNLSEHNLGLETHALRAWNDKKYVSSKTIFLVILETRNRILGIEDAQTKKTINDLTKLLSEMGEPELVTQLKGASVNQEVLAEWLKKQGIYPPGERNQEAYGKNARRRKSTRRRKSARRGKSRKDNH
jgi:hypothetical protein